MQSTSASVCLNMIVKDEAPVIARCLASARPLIDHWCIVDTGSSDRTPELIADALAGIPGTLHHRPWKNFGHNRSEAVTLAGAEQCDYLLFIDADEVFAVPESFAWPALTEDAYELTCHYAGVVYARRAMVATRLPWRWMGVLHEYPDCGNDAHSCVALPQPAIHVSHDGARARNPSTYIKDITILEAALRSEPNNARYVFYLAQSYRDCGRWTDARTTYERRATMGGWDEEVWYSLFQVAVLTERLAEAPERVSAAFLRAFQKRPSRAESLAELARFHRLRGENAIAYLYARLATEIALPHDRLFVDKATYEWRALDELAISAYYVGTATAFAQGAAAAKTLLDPSSGVPATEQERIQKNADFYGA